MNDYYPTKPPPIDPYECHPLGTGSLINELAMQNAELREMVKDAKPLVAYAHADAEIDRTEYGGAIEEQCTRWIARAAEMVNQEDNNGNV